MKYKLHGYCCRPTGPAVRLEITTSAVRVDGRPVTDLASLAGGDPAREAAALADLRAALTAADPVPAAISIHCDRRLDFRLLKRVLRTCHEAGGDDLSLLVLREES